MEYYDGLFDELQSGDRVTVVYRHGTQPERVLTERLYFLSVSNSHGGVVTLFRALEKGKPFPDQLIPREQWKEDRNYIPFSLKDIVELRNDDDLPRDDQNGDPMTEMLLPEGFDYVEGDEEYPNGSEGKGREVLEDR